MPRPNGNGPPPLAAYGQSERYNFLIDRDGGIRTALPGCGHADHALDVARERP